MIFTEESARPAIITGKNGEGKTSTVREILSKWPGNAFILDTTGIDYPDFKHVDLGEFFGTKWGKEGLRLRFVSNRNLEVSKAEAAMVFTHLNFHGATLRPSVPKLERTTLSTYSKWVGLV